MNDYEMNEYSVAIYNEQYMRDTMIVVSCSNKKKSYNCQAQEMYSESILFRKTKDYIIKNYGGRYVILSSKYGIILPNKEIEPYDLFIKDIDKEHKKRLIYNIYFNLLPFKELIVFGGKEYVNIIKQACPKLKIIEPLKGLGIGKRLQFLSE